MRLMILLALLLVSGSLSAQTQGAIKRVCHVSRFELAVACIKKYEGLHGPKHHPYVGYGHKLLPGEKFSPRMTERQADANKYLVPTVPKQEEGEDNSEYEDRVH